MAPTKPEGSSTTPDSPRNKNIDKVKKSTPTKKNVQTIASVVRSIEVDSGLKLAAQEVDQSHHVKKTAVDQLKIRPVLTPEDLWQLPKVSKKNQKRSARGADLDDNPVAPKTKDSSTGKVEFARSIAFPKIKNFDPVEEYKYAYIWADAHPNCAPGPGIEDDWSPGATGDIKSDELAPRRRFKSRRTFAVSNDFWISYQLEHAWGDDRDEDPMGLTYWWTRAVTAEKHALQAEQEKLKAEGEQRSATARLETSEAENHALAAALNELEEEYAGYKRLHSREHVKSLIRKEGAKLADRTGTLDYEVKDLKVRLKKANEKATEAETKCREAAASETRARSEKKKENYSLKLKLESMETERAKLQKENNRLTDDLAQQKSIVEELDKDLAKGKTNTEKLNEELARRIAKVEELETEVEMYKSFEDTA